MSCRQHWISGYCLTLLFGWSVLGSAHAQSSPVENSTDFAHRICNNLGVQTQRILDDVSDTQKYLSPYIAVDLYQEVVAISQPPAPSPSAGAGEAIPEMSALPCQDKVSAFMMAIKQRMEYGRLDRLLGPNRGWKIGLVILMLLGGWWFVRQRRRATLP